MRSNFKVFIAAIAIAVLAPVITLAASYFYVGTNGDLGIGTDSPLAPLDVVGSIYSRLVNPTDAASTTIDWSAGNVQSLTLDTSNTTLAFSNGEAGGEYKLVLKQDATGGRTVTWPASVEWAGGTAPTLSATASSTDVASFVYDGTYYLGSYNLDYAVPTPAIAFDNATDTSQSTQNPSLSYNVSGSNTLLIAVLFENSGDDDVTGVTYNGNSLTQENKVQLTSGNYCYEYALLGASTGSNTLSISRSSSGSGQGLGIAIASYDNVKQSGFPDASHSTTGTTVGTISDSVTTSADNAWVMTGYCTASNNGPVYAGTGTTERTSTPNVAGIFDSNGGIHPAGSATLYLNNSASAGDRWGLMTLSFAPAN